MKNKTRAKYQKQFNKRIHALNANIAADDLWKGRFIFLQRDCVWNEFYDHSGGELVVFVRAYDKATGYYHDYRLTYAPWMQTFNWHLTMDVGNTFIVTDLDIWQNEKPQLETSFDYRNTKVNVEELMRKPWNFYITYEHFDEWKNNLYK